MDKKMFERKWLAVFAADISAQDLQKYVVRTGNYIWHVFSWELLPKHSYLCGDAARAAYDSIDKTHAVYIEPFQHSRLSQLPSALTSSAAIEQLTEVYVAAEDFSWSYIKTHENDLCGPYFIAAKERKICV